MWIEVLVAVTFIGVVAWVVACLPGRILHRTSFDPLAYDPQRETKRHIRAEIARLKRNKKRFSHLQAELDRMNGVAL